MALPTLFQRGRTRSVPVRREEDVFTSLQREMNLLFEDFWRGFDLPVSMADAWSTFTPRVDVEETEDEVRVTADLPGLEEKDFEVQLADQSLVVKGEKREEREDRARGWHERAYGAFERSIPLPCEVDADRVSAEFKNGVLRVRLPKAATARGRVKRIPIAA